MEQISIRAVIISNLVQLGLIFSLAFVVSMGSLAAGWAWAGFPDDIKPVIAGLRSSPLFIPLLQAVTVIPASVFAGHLARRIARSRPLLHGALSCCAWILVLILIAMYGPSGGHTPHGGPPAPPQAGFSIGSFLSSLLGTAISIGTPLLGVLGAVIGHQRSPAASSLRSGEGTVSAKSLRYPVIDRK